MTRGNMLLVGLGILAIEGLCICGLRSIRTAKGGAPALWVPEAPADLARPPVVSADPGEVEVGDAVS